MIHSRRLILFAKRPRLGCVKTRLVPPLTPEQALSLYRAFLIDQLALLRLLANDYTVEVSVDDAWEPDAQFVSELDGLTITEQGGGDLGRRLTRAFRRSRESGSGSTVVIGVDSPTLPAQWLRQAFEVLAAGAAAVISPAEDGGYVLLGLNDPIPALFRDVPWGSSRVFEITRRRAAETGLDLAQLEPWYDVDDIVGLDRLRTELADPKAAQRANATARYLQSLQLP